MPFDITNVLFVADRDRYAQYRAEIAPLLKASGAAFRYDFEIAKTLQSETPHDINRMFVLGFPSREAKQRFFTDPRYLEIRARLFETAVEHMTTISEQTV